MYQLIFKQQKRPPQNIKKESKKSNPVSSSSRSTKVENMVIGLCSIDEEEMGKNSIASSSKTVKKEVTKKGKEKVKKKIACVSNKEGKEKVK
jgi:hypothetical protein